MEKEINSFNFFKEHLYGSKKRAIQVVKDMFEEMSSSKQFLGIDIKRITTQFIQFYRKKEGETVLYKAIESLLKSFPNLTYESSDFNKNFLSELVMYCTLYEVEINEAEKSFDRNEFVSDGDLPF